MADSPITEEIIKRLVAGVNTRDVHIGDFSDVQLYGRKFRRRLDGIWKESASEVGCEPVVYQSILWWTLVWIPIVSQISYFVMPYRECIPEELETDRYRCLPAPTLGSQVALHYVTGLFVVGAIVLLFWWGHSRVCASEK